MFVETHKPLEAAAKHKILPPVIAVNDTPFGTAETYAQSDCEDLNRRISRLLMVTHRDI